MTASDLVRHLRYLARHPLRRGGLCTAAIDLARWYVGARLVPGPILCPLAEDVKFLAYPHSTIQANVLTGFAEFSDMALVCHALRAADLFVDVGANAGIFTLLASGISHARTVAIEPVPAIYNRLEENVAVNNLGSLVTCIQCAVGQAPGVVAVTTNQDGLNHVVVQGEREGCVDVEQRTLDEILAGLSPTFMKIDVEGYEAFALAGASTVLQQDSLIGVLIELNGHGRRHGVDENCIHDLLSHSGFALCDYSPRERLLTEVPRQGARGTSNQLYVRDVDRMRRRVRGGRGIRVKGVLV